MSGPAAGGAELTSVARYTRTIGASVERVWENVRDWEHLPWLHSSSFTRIDCSEAGAWGWRARVGLPRGGGLMSLELLIEPDGGRYVTRTLDGPGAGTEIWTRVTPLDAERTGIEVEFQVPDVPPDRAAALGASYTQLYARLWDEDEAMMVRRGQELARLRAAAPARPATLEIDLGPEPEVRARAPFVVECGGASWRVVRVDGGLAAHATTCPHSLGPLDDAPVEEGRVRCPWHGYVFDVATGRSCDGARLRLPTARIAVGADGGLKLTAPPRS